MSEINKPDVDSVLYYEGKEYKINAHYNNAYAFRMHNWAGEGFPYIALFNECARNDQGFIVALEIHEEINL